MKSKTIVLIGTLPFSSKNFSYTDGQCEAFKSLLNVVKNIGGAELSVVDILNLFQFIYPMTTSTFKILHFVLEVKLYQ